MFCYSLCPASSLWQSSCLWYLSAGMTGMYHHISHFKFCFWKPRSNQSSCILVIISVISIIPNLFLSRCWLQGSQANGLIGILSIFYDFFYICSPLPIFSSKTLPHSTSPLDGTFYTLVLSDYFSTELFVLSTPHLPTPHHHHLRCSH